MIRLSKLLNEQYENESFGIDIDKETIDNDNFRKVLHTTQTLQLVVMSIDEDIGWEVHPRTTQFLRVEAGTGEAIIDGQTHELKDGMSVIVPPGARHNIINTGKKPLKLYSLYSPPHHAPGKIDKEKP